jgi:hypothetical protein
MIAPLRRILLSIAAASSALVLNSCLELYNEEMTIHPDLSGEAKITVELPDTLVEKYDKVQQEFTVANIEKRFAAAKGVKLRSYTLTEGRKPKATFEISFTSVANLNDAIAANAPASVLAGEFVVTKEAEGYSKIVRTLGKGTPAMDLPSDNFANYKVHFDTPIVVQGTNSEFYDQPHNDMRYRWPMAQIVANQPSIENKIKRPFPWEWIMIAVLALLLVTWFGWLVFGSVKKKMALKARAKAAEAAAQGAEEPAARGPQRPGPPRRPGPPGR